MHLIINSQKEIIRKEERVKKISNDNLNVLNNYLIYCKDNQNSNRTLEVIDLYLRIFILFIEKQNRKITDIDSILIKNYVVELEKQKSLFNKQRDLWLLRTFLRYLNLFNYLDADYSYLVPTMKRIPKSIPTIWSEDELNQFLNSNQYDKHSKYINCSFNGITSITENDIEDYLECVLDDTPSGEVLEIIQEEYDDNDMGEVKV